MRLEKEQLPEKICMSSLLFPLCKEQKGSCLEMHFRKEQTVLCGVKG